MPGLIEPKQVGKRQDLSDYIVNIQRTDTPLFTALPKDSVRNTTFETQVDDYGETDNIEGVGSNEDADTFDNMAENRGIMTNQVMKMRETPAVDDFSENVTENEALPEGEYADAVRKAIVRLKFRMEKLLLSRVEARRQENGKKYRTCSIGGFIKDGAPYGSQFVPKRFRPSDGQIYDGLLADLRESHFTDILQEIFEATHGMGKFSMISGSDLIKKVNLMTVYKPDVAGHTVMRRFNSSDATVIEMKVDIISGSFGTITIVPTTRMCYFDKDGEPTSKEERRGSGLILDLSRWGLAFKRKPGHKSLEDKGGGPRGIVDTIFGLRAKAPMCNGAIYVKKP